jgi:hypothetical protein
MIHPQLVRYTGRAHREKIMTRSKETGEDQLFATRSDGDASTWVAVLDAVVRAGSSPHTKPSVIIVCRLYHEPDELYFPAVSSEYHTLPCSMTRSRRYDHIQRPRVSIFLLATSNATSADPQSPCNIIHCAYRTNDPFPSLCDRAQNPEL